MKENFKLHYSIFALVLFVCTLYFGYAAQQVAFWQMLPVFAGFFGIYLWIIYLPKAYFKAKRFYWWIALAMLLRFSLLFAIPTLSDDIYRFIWDGRLLQNGINPFAQLPAYYIEQASFPKGITPALFEQLNSPNYYTIYPPIAQLTFFVATWLFPESIWGSSFVMKTFLFAFECGNIYLLIKLLPQFGIDRTKALIYALNPLIVIEITGNLHFEGAMIFFLLLSLFFLLKSEMKWRCSQRESSLSSSDLSSMTTKKEMYPNSVSLSENQNNQERKKANLYFILSASTFALSIASKLLPLLFLPLFIKRLGWWKSLVYFSIIGMLTLLLFVPLLSGVFVQNFGESLNLYFQKFEFNASIYYVARWVGFQLKGFNLIAKLGPALAFATFLSILALSFFHSSKRIKDLPLLMLFAISMYLSFTTTVHPWYVSLPLVLCCFTAFRYPILWSGLIFLTYINYSYATYQENLWVVALEYSLIGTYFLWEYFFKKKGKPSNIL
ncbi:MAG: hypothetical protein AAF849_15945 [Bacteroidota bacterium]